MGSFSIWHWLIVLVIVLLIFGTKKLRNIGADLGGAVKGFKDGVKGGEEDKKPAGEITTASFSRCANPTTANAIASITARGIHSLGISLPYLHQFRNRMALASPSAPTSTSALTRPSAEPSLYTRGAHVRMLFEELPTEV